MTTQSTTRRERRAAQRAARQQEAQRRDQRGLILGLSMGGVVVALVLFVVLAVSGFGSSRTDAIRPAAVQPPPIDLTDGRSLGQADAPVRIDLWADFQCPICRRFALDIEPLLRAGPVADGTVRLTYHDLAFIGPESIDAAVAARAAESLGASFWAYHDLLFANQGATENGGVFSRDRLADMAVSLGLDRVRFLNALDRPELRAAVTAETMQGNAQGVTSTPTLVIDGKAYAGLPSFDQLSALIAQLAAKSAGSPAP